MIFYSILFYSYLSGSFCFQDLTAFGDYEAIYFNYLLTAASSTLTLIRMTKDEKGLDFSKAYCSKNS